MYDKEAMKKALAKRKMDGLDLTIIVGSPESEKKDSELAPGAPDDEAMEEKLSPGLHAKAAEVMHAKGLGEEEEEAEEAIDPKIHEKVARAMANSPMHSSPLVAKAFKKKA